MKALVVNSFVERYDELYVSEVTSPERNNNEVLIEVRAAGLNFVDLLYARGKHQNNRCLVTPPFILGLEFAGVVISVPSSCEFSKGDRVFGSGQGSFAEVISVKASNLRKVPERWTFSDAAGLGATAPVSYGALISRGNIEKGETVLIHAAAGGLGLMAVQIANAVGARVIATAGSEEKLAIARKYGAHECVNYNHSDDWWKEVLVLTDNVGVDLVFDSVGLVDKTLKCLKHKGRILVVGFAGTEGMIEKIAMNKVLLRQAQIIGYRYGESDRRYPKETQKIWLGMMAMIRKGLIRPCVFDHVYKDLSAVPDAMNDIATRKIWGKAVVTISEDQCKALL